MEEARKKIAERLKATIVRQFAPSRIEWQLLAQAFELVCQGSDSEDISTAERWRAGSISRSESVEPASASDARRRVS